MTWYSTMVLADVWENPTPAIDRRSRNTFKATYGQTLVLLEREIEFLDPHRDWGQTHVVMHVACRPDDLKLDGNLRADARPFQHPGVRLTFNTKTHGDLSYATDKYQIWQHNVRAIALSLHALRAVDRYGVTGHGQQYTGFKALPAGRSMPASHMTSEQARNLLAKESGLKWHEVGLTEHLRRARKATHPDHNGGDQSRWDKVEAAARELSLA